MCVRMFNACLLLRSSNNKTQRGEDPPHFGEEPPFFFLDCPIACKLVRATFSDAPDCYWSLVCPTHTCFSLLDKHSQSVPVPDWKESYQECQFHSCHCAAFFSEGKQAEACCSASQWLK